ncbi:MAG TPA: hypothetical protein VG755_14570 [Nannocystaceae bacterium]|nr:hypothetical protein [Nannocystaceae bacterium]
MPASLRHGEVLASAAVVAAVGAWVGAVARSLLALPALAALAPAALALAVLGLATLVDRRTRASLVDDAELAGGWSIECARRRRQVATNLLVALAAIGLMFLLRCSLLGLARPT